MPIRLAILGLPRLLADLIAEAFSDDDAVEIDALPGEATLDTDVAGSHDVIIVGVTDPSHSPLVDRVCRVSQPKLFGVRTDGRGSWIYRMQPCPVSLGLIGPAQIRSAVLASQDKSA